MRVLLAFDKFKDSLTAPEACDAAARALRAAHPDWSLQLCPLADGGEGFAEILTHAVGGKMEKISVTGPRGGNVEASFGLVAISAIPPAALALLKLGALANAPASTLAIIEMAAASGLALLPADQRDPWQTSTTGTGQLILRAAELGANAVLLGVGGSATSDLGLGALQSLGLKFQTMDGKEVHLPAPARWAEIAEIHGAVPRPFPALRIACDVTNPLLGARGAAAVYGAQKGLLPGDIRKLDHASARIAMMLSAHCRQSDELMDAPGAGAAGGLPFGLMTAAGAQLLPGFALVSAWLNLDAQLATADLVITGEGRFDDSSRQGKGPGAVVSRALALGKTVHVFAGAVTASTSVTPELNLTIHAITPPGTELTDALRAAAENLASAVRRAFA